MNTQKWSSPFIFNVWSDTTEEWTDHDWRVVGHNRSRSKSLAYEELVDQDWRIVGHNRSRSRSLAYEELVDQDWRIVGYNRSRCINPNPNSLPNSNINTYTNLNLRRLSEPIINMVNNMSVGDILSLSNNLYIIEFKGGRLDVGYFIVEEYIELKNNIYIILEADRGEDLGRVKCKTSKEKYRRLLSRIDKNENVKEVHPKRIYRLAEDKDLEMFKYKEELEKNALVSCKDRVREKGLGMEVVECEYQWDMNKLTFYFKSDKRIDFRDLVKELYKVYKTRIWMCAVEKSKNYCLSELCE